MAFDLTSVPLTTTNNLVTVDTGVVYSEGLLQTLAQDSTSFYSIINSSFGQSYDPQIGC